jgi:hypothetical protein
VKNARDYALSCCLNPELDLEKANGHLGVIGDAVPACRTSLLKLQLVWYARKAIPQFCIAQMLM